MLWSVSARPEEGMAVHAMFVEVDELRNRLILSQKQVLQAALLKQVQPGDTVEARRRAPCLPCAACGCARQATNASGNRICNEICQTLP
jgi:membrane protease subunit (stomatin/prohibitin family)